MGKREDKALETAIRSGSVPAARAALKAGANPNATDEGYPLLWLAATRNAALVKLMLAHGAEPNVLTSTGQSPLAAACVAKAPVAVDVLIAAGAKAELRSGLEDPLLITAVRSKNVRIVKAVLAAGARDVANVSGHRASTYATPAIAKLLAKSQPKSKKK
ncbi:MAG: ankyrin repeat domain-containing protein [Kofleriaceae bacterium]